MRVKERILNFLTIEKEIENNLIKPIYLVYGEEDYLHRAFFDKIREYFSKQKQMANYEIFYGEKLDFNRLLNSLQALPLGTGMQCVVVRNLEKIKSPLMKKLTFEIDKLSFNYTNLMILLFSNGKRIPLHINSDKIAKYGAIVSLPKMNMFQTKQWIKMRCQEAQIEINEEAIYYLQRITENDLAQISNELEKLFCYLGNSKTLIDKEILIKNIYGIQGGNIFDFVDAVGVRKSDEALSLLKILMDSGEYHPLQILAMLNRQMRLIFKTKLSSYDSKKNKGDKNLPYFVLKKLTTQSQKYNVGELKKVFHYLLDAEISLKTGYLLPNLVLEQLVIKITK
jgi:DNA polymerase-3 subunit delta